MHSRFVRASGGGTEFEAVPGVERGEEDWDKMDGWKEVPVKAGTMVLIHGELIPELSGFVERADARLGHAPLAAEPEREDAHDLHVPHD